MLRTKALALCAAAAAALTVSTTAHAAISSKLTNVQQGTLPGSVQTGITPNAAVPGDQYTVFTGLASSAGLVLIEGPAASPLTDDTVTFDGLIEALNPYATTPPTPRTVIESTIDNGNGTNTLSIHVSAGTMDLWPAGFTDGDGAPLTGGGFAVGFNLPDTLDNGVVGPTLAFTPQTITGVKLVFNNDPTDFATLPNSFFSVTPAGQASLGVSFGGATGLGITDLDLQVTYLVPEPASASVLGIGALAVLRRRRRSM